MTRTQKDAAGKDVPTNTAAFGCQTVEHAKPAAKPAPEPKPKASAKASPTPPAEEEAPAGNEGEE